MSVTKVECRSTIFQSAISSRHKKHISDYIQQRRVLYQSNLHIPVTLSLPHQVFYYSTLIFRDAGLDLYQSQAVSIGAGAINALMGILAIPLIK